MKEFLKVDGVVNFETTQDALNKNLNRGFGFLTFKNVETCKAAHAKYHKDKLQILVSTENPSRETASKFHAGANSPFLVLSSCFLVLSSCFAEAQEYS